MTSINPILQFNTKFPIVELYVHLSGAHSNRAFHAKLSFELVRIHLKALGDAKFSQVHPVPDRICKDTPKSACIYAQHRVRYHDADWLWFSRDGRGVVAREWFLCHEMSPQVRYWKISETILSETTEKIDQFLVAFVEIWAELQETGHFTRCVSHLSHRIMSGWNHHPVANPFVLPLARIRSVQAPYLIAFKNLKLWAFRRWSESHTVLLPRSLASNATDRKMP